MQCDYLNILSSKSASLSVSSAATASADSISYKLLGTIDDMFLACVSVGLFVKRTPYSTILISSLCFIRVVIF